MTKQTNFKRGDKVRYVGNNWPDRKDWLGEVINVIVRPHRGNSGYIEVKFDLYSTPVRCFGSSLERVNDEINNV